MKKQNSNSTAPVPAGKDRRRRPPTYTVGFRLDAYYLQRLERGAARYGISIHEYARQRLTELLDGQEAAPVLDEISRARTGVDELREDVARTLEILLVNLTRAEPQEVRLWVDAHLRRE